MKENIAGKKFGRLTAVKHTGSTKRWQAIWKFRCDCGAELEIVADNVKRGLTKSCGCLAREVSKATGEKNAKHGHHDKPTYTSYHAMLQRCLNPKSRNYPQYGAAGITVCERWMSGFEFFLEDMGVRPPGKTLDRRDGKKGYSPENCRWATEEEQNNNLRSNRIIEFQGITRTVAEWARAVGIPDNTLRKRLGYMSVTDALTKPYVSRRKH